MRVPKAFPRHVTSSLETSALLYTTGRRFPTYMNRSVVLARQLNLFDSFGYRERRYNPCLPEITVGSKKFFHGMRSRIYSKVKSIKILMSPRSTLGRHDLVDRPMIDNQFLSPVAFLILFGNPRQDVLIDIISPVQHKIFRILFSSETPQEVNNPISRGQNRQNR